MLLVGSAGLPGVVQSQAAEIKWSPRVGQEWTYECESGAPGWATSWFYFHVANTLTIRIEAVTEELVTIKYTNKVTLAGTGKGQSFDAEPETELRQYKRNGEPIGETDYFPTSLARTATYGSYSGFTYPNKLYHAGTSWGVEVSDTSRTPPEIRAAGHSWDYTGTLISTFVGFEKVGEVDCWKIAYRSLGLDGRQVIENAGTAWLDKRDGSIVRVKEGERPPSFDIWNDEVLSKMSGYCDMRLVASAKQV